MMKQLLRTIKNKLFRKPVYNMHSDNAEQFYYEQYSRYISQYFIKGRYMLDAGCQYGRFTLPALEAGMRVHCTDLDETYFKYIADKSDSSQVSFSRETLDETIRSHPENKFDVIICTELLYYVKNPEKYLAGFQKMLKHGGILITSHRSIGYYLYRFLKEGKIDQAEQIISGTHRDYNAQTETGLIEVLKKAGLKPEITKGIGIFTGTGNDAFTNIIDPSSPLEFSRERLISLEEELLIQKHFINNARYILAVSTKPS